mgnify:FL=1|jgi:hypothetical protein
MLDSVRFNLVQRDGELLAYSKNYHERFGGPTKQSIIKLLREEFGAGHCTIRRKRLIYTKAVITKKADNNT